MEGELLGPGGLLDPESPFLCAASHGAVETSVLQSCITEAKFLVDAAYNQTQRT